jgi:pyruvate carboxylase
LLRGAKPIEGRAGAKLPAADFDAVRAELAHQLDREPDWGEVLSHLLYPQVFEDYAAKCASYSDVSVLPTPVFFYGMKMGEEWTIDLEAGKTLVVKFLTVGEPPQGWNADNLF